MNDLSNKAGAYCGQVICTNGTGEVTLDIKNYDSQRKTWKGLNVTFVLPSLAIGDYSICYVYSVSEKSENIIYEWVNWCNTVIGYFIMSKTKSLLLNEYWLKIKMASKAGVVGTGYIYYQVW